MPPDLTASTSGSTPVAEDGPPEGSRRLLLIAAVLGVVSIAIAAVVIFSSGGSTTPAEEPQAELRASGEALIVGSSDAPTEVVVFEDFGNPQSRDFEIASRDFLRIEAAVGKVRVEYRPFHLADGYSRRALEAWVAVLEGGTARETLAFHDELFDRQPAADAVPTAAELEAWAVDAGVEKELVSDAVERPDPDFAEASSESARAAGIRTAPTVLVDGKLFGAGTGVELADQLQRKLLAD